MGKISWLIIVLTFMNWCVSMGEAFKLILNMNFDIHFNLLFYTKKEGIHFV